PDNPVQLRMQQRLAATDGYDRGAERAKLVHALEHEIGRHRLRKIVILVAIFACEIAASNWNEMRQQRMIGREESPGDLAPAVNAARERDHAATNSGPGGGHAEFLLFKHNGGVSASF